MFDFGKKKKKIFCNPFVIKTGGFKYGKLEKYSHLREWIENSFIPAGGESEVVGRTFDFSKLRVIWFFLIIFIAVLTARTAWLQIVRGDYYQTIAEGNSIRIKSVEAKRGIIYDRNKKPLVINIANLLLYFIPADLPKEEEEKEELISQVGEILFPENEEERDNLAWRIREDLKGVKAGFLNSYQPLFVADNIEYEKAMLLYLNSFYLPGVILSDKSRRQYLNEDSLSLSHILGYTGKVSAEELKMRGGGYSLIDYIGKAGLEYFWENELRGKNGEKKVEVDALGYEKKIISQTEVGDGNNLILSVDYDLQKKSEEVLKKYLGRMNLRNASVIIMNPENGEIMALVSLPAFNNNVFAGGISQKEYNELIGREDNSLFNRAISGEYPSGSTIKPVIAAAALQEKIISEHTSFLSVGGIGIDKWFFPDWRSGGHGITDVRKALADSVNTFFYYIGGGYDEFTGLGVERIAKYLNLFGLGEQTRIDLIGEAGGLIPTSEWKEETKEEKWYIGDTYHLAIGQGDVLVTPLQVANYTAFFANGGKLPRPHLVKDILSGDDKLIKNIKAAPIRENFISSYNVEVVRQGMRQAVISGSSIRLSDLPVAVAGKTGTAEWSGKFPAHAWWTGFAPYKEPEIVLTVMVEEGAEGSQIGVSIAKEIISYYFDKAADKQ